MNFEKFQKAHKKILRCKFQQTDTERFLETSIIPLLFCQ